MVPETIPVAPIDLVRIEIDQIVEPVLDHRALGGGAVGQAPVAEHARRVDVRRRGHQLGRRRGGAGHRLQRRRLRGGGQCPQHQFAGPRDSLRRTPAGFVILIGDVETLVLGRERLHPHRPAIGAQVHRLCIRRPQPRGQRRAVGGGVADIDLGRMALPEIACRDRRAAQRRPDVAEAGRPPALARVDPALRRAGALGEREAACRQLRQREIRPWRNPLQQRSDRRAHLGHGRRRAARHLRVAKRLAGIAAQARQRAHRFGEHRVIAGRQPDVAIVQVPAHRNTGRHAQSGQEQLGRVDIQYETVDDAQRARPGIGIEADRERQDRSPAALMPPLDADDRADRPALLDHDALDDAGQRHTRAIGRSGAHFAGQPGILQQDATAVARRAHDRGSAAADVPAQGPADDQDAVRRFAHRHRRRARCRRSGRHTIARGRRVRRRHRMRAPLDRSVGPGRRHPALHGHRRAAPVGKLEPCLRSDAATRPWHTPRLAVVRRRRCVIEPADGSGLLRRPSRRGRGPGQHRRRGTCQQSGAQDVAPADHLSHHPAPAYYLVHRPMICALTQAGISGTP